MPARPGSAAPRRAPAGEPAPRPQSAKPTHTEYVYDDGDLPPTAVKEAPYLTVNRCVARSGSLIAALREVLPATEGDAFGILDELEMQLEMLRTTTLKRKGSPPRKGGAKMATPMEDDEDEDPFGGMGGLDAVVVEVDRHVGSQQRAQRLRGLQAALAEQARRGRGGRGSERQHEELGVESGRQQHRRVGRTEDG